jgi:hypothetical protein
MPITYDEELATFTGVVEVDEAEGLLAWVQRVPTPQVALAPCEHVHTANLVVLMAARPTVTSWPVDVELGCWLRWALDPEGG